MEFVLESDIPGVCTIFSISVNDCLQSFQDNSTIEVNFDKTFKKLTGRKRIVNDQPAKPLAVTLGSEDPLKLNDPFKKPLLPPARASNYLERTIEKIEKKIYDFMNIKKMKDVSDDHSFENDDSSSCQSSVRNTPPAKKKRTQKKGEDYDYSDGFLDDSELIDELDVTLNQKRMKTKHEGFFVSSGDLEVVKVALKPKVPKQKAKETSDSIYTTQEISVPVIAQDTNKPVSKVKENTGKKEGKKQSKVQAVTEVNSENTNNENDSIPSLSLPTNENEKFATESGMDETVEDKNQEDGETKKVKTPVEKPLWNPPQEILDSLEKFRILVGELQIQPSKRNSIPKELEIPIYELDKIVLQHFNQKQINKISGYYEFIQNLLGPNITPGKTKHLLMKIGLKEKAQLDKVKINQLIEDILIETKENVIPCPDNKQPANKVPRKKKSMTKEELNAALHEEGNEPLEPIQLMNDQTPKFPESQSVIPSVQENITPVDAEKTTENSEFIQSEPMEVDNNVTITNDIELASPSQHSASAITYQWFCKWTIPLKQKLVNLEDLVMEWVSTENKYREKLNAQDKKDMEEQDVRTL